MQSGVYAADALADGAGAARDREAGVVERYAWSCRQRFTFGFVMGHVLAARSRRRCSTRSRSAYNSPLVRKAATWALGSALAGSHVDASGSRAQAVVSSAASAAPGNPFPRGQVAAN